MDSFKERPANTDVYARINVMPMSEIEREVAVNALRDAEKIADAMLWVSNRIEQLFAGSALKPSLKH